MKRLEHPFFVGGFDSGSVVANANLKMARSVVLGGNFNSVVSRGFGVLAGVVDEVEQDLFDRGRLSLNRANVRFGIQ